MPGPKVLIPIVIRDHNHPFDPDVVEYNVCAWDPEIEDWVFYYCGPRVSINITGTTTWADIQAVMTADAMNRGYLP